MSMTSASLTRRQWIAGTGMAAACAAMAKAQAGAPARPKVAAVFTELRLRSHPYHFLSNLMGPYLFRGQWIDPGVDVVSWYADQFPRGDMAKEGSEKYKVPLYK